MSCGKTLIDVDAVAEHCTEPDWCLLDCRFDLLDPDAGRKAYLDGHLPNARYVDLNQDLAAALTPGSGRHPLPEPQRLAGVFGGLGIGETTQVIVYDDSGGAIAARAWWLLRWLGHQRVSILNGGISEWLRHGLALQQGPVPSVTARFRIRSPGTQVIEIRELSERLATDLKKRLVDARNSERFRGDAEPIDAVAGHIPGAVNLPFSECLAPSGRFRPVAELRKAWREVLCGDISGPVAVMCGSGVTACHLVAAALEAGLAEPMVYVGSWSEWISDPERPVATGPSGQQGE